MVYDLILMDGTVLQTTASGVGQQGDLWIHVVGIDFMNCVTIFEDPKKTEKMGHILGQNGTEDHFCFRIL